MGSFPMKVSFVWPFPRSSKMVTSYAPSMASCSIPSCAGSILFPFESEKYIKETIFFCGTISWYSTAFQNSCPSVKKDFQLRNHCGLNLSCDIKIFDDRIIVVSDFVVVVAVRVAMADLFYFNSFLVLLQQPDHLYF